MCYGGLLCEEISEIHKMFKTNFLMHLYECTLAFSPLVDLEQM